jgi:RNA polymerase sigma-70 factor (ECF subfamily)
MKTMAVAPEAREARLPADGHETAEELFEAHSGWVYGYCLRILRSPEEAEDALQTTYLNACRSLNQGVRPKAGSAWLLRIAQNVCFTRLRSSGRRSTVERPQDIAVLQETVAAPDYSKDDLVGLSDALLGMPERQREAILLREWRGLSYSEIAAELDMTQSAVETLIFRARRSLAAGLEEPPKRARLRSVLAFDFAGMLAVLKGLLAGGAGVKTAATLAVVAATTTTIVATDPVAVLSDRERSTGTPELSTAAPAPATTAASPARLGAIPSNPAALLDGKARPARGDVQGKANGKQSTTPPPGSKGNGHGNSNGNGGSGPANATSNASQGNGKAQAPGQLKEPGAPAQGKGASVAETRPAPPGRNGTPPPSAKAPEKTKQGKGAN